ncbi:MAG: ATP-binding protein [Terracidiphilus sp.]|nr:ATP-binding protein [Terracidiphilus sp.]
MNGASISNRKMDGQAAQILIIDDDEGDRKQIRRAIRQSGMKAACVETCSIKEALSACERCEFDCAIVDYWLPGEDGLEGITALQQKLPFVAIIMSTGHGDEIVAVEAMRRGAADYISKALVNAVSIRIAITRALEKSILQRKVWEQQNELENFARVLAHDLISPAASVQTFARRIAERLQEGSPEKALQYADYVIQTAERMSRLIGTLHQYTQADAQVTFDAVDLNQALNEAQANLQNLIQAQGSVVTSKTLPTVFGNAPLLIQLLQNLIGNGIKYCDDPVARIQVEASEKDENTWLISVTDNGIGIPKAEQKTVFEPFVRASTARKREGTGLGLATCKKIIERHGGAIWCESTPGASTTLFFTLPGVDRAACSSPEPGPPAESCVDAQPARR